MNFYQISLNTVHTKQMVAPLRLYQKATGKKRSHQYLETLPLNIDGDNDEPDCHPELKLQIMGGTVAPLDTKSVFLEAIKLPGMGLFIA